MLRRLINTVSPNLAECGSYSEGRVNALGCARTLLLNIQLRAVGFWPIPAVDEINLDVGEAVKPPQPQKQTIRISGARNHL